MQHNLFKPRSFDEGKHAVVGDCNGISMEKRYEQETPIFARKILSLSKEAGVSILDYGCGVGRLSKELIKQSTYRVVVGVDNSVEMRVLATENVNDNHFEAKAPEDLKTPKLFHIAVLVYVLQHIPAIEIREALQRIHYSLKDDGYLFYCSSDYRMAIRFDGKGFFDDRFLGVNLQEELSRFFELEGPAFTDKELNANPVLKTMITGKGADLPHPALIYRKKKIGGPLFNAQANENNKETIKKDLPGASNFKTQMKGRKLILANPLSPGDILVSTSAFRDLHKAYPNEYITDFRVPSGCEQIFENNPYITHIDDDDPEATYIRLNYEEIHRSGQSGRAFMEAHTIDLAKELGRHIPHTTLRPDIFLSQDEVLWPSPVVVKRGYEGKYWVLNAGSKDDFTLKQYPFYQELVDLLEGKITFVQIGMKEHNHKPLKGVIDMVGETDIRGLVRLISKAEGVVACVSFPMHLAGALSKPCVVVAGGREGTRWELYPDHRFLYTNGVLDCCKYNGCWKNKHDDCLNLDDGVPLCMKIITPEMIAQAIEMYYKGGLLSYEKEMSRLR